MTEDTVKKVTLAIALLSLVVSVISGVLTIYQMTKEKE
jgi:ABC-type spermidine/putrescine transport system permease subunit II